MQSPFLRRLREKVIIADGAMGTMIQARNLSSDDFEGLDGCNEYLCITRPKIIQDIHAAYLEVGADIIETNSFGSSAHVLAEYGISERSFEISKRSAELAREVADEYSSRSWQRFVAGAVGPGTKLVTLGHINFDSLYQAYYPCMKGLIAGGVDLVQIETCQDILQVKCAVIAARDAMLELKREVPICTTLTIETTGTMLIGTEMAAALVVLETMPIHMVGMNCATGPDMMQENVRFLGRTSSRPIAILPNAGLPRNESGRAVYDLTPESLADFQEGFVRDYGVAMVGGCCGTTPEHIRALVSRVGGLSPRERPHDFASHISSTYGAVALDQDNTPLIIGERCNANGSKAFKELLLKEDWEAITEMGKTEVVEGAHAVDVCTAFVGRAEARDMQEVLFRFATQVVAPVVIDTTQLDVLEAALKLIGGRPIINSINLEDGEERFDKVANLANRFGAALIALTIDEEGMAKSAQRKLEVARRIHDRLTKLHGIPPEAILFDPLTFTIASGDEDSRRAAIETLDAIALIKREIPKVRTILGLSNVSFGLKPYPRQILNSVFLAEARKVGLDACIINSKKILPLSKIDSDLIEVTRDLIFDRRKPGYDPLFKFIEVLQGAKAATTDDSEADKGTIEEILKKRIIDGKKVGIEPLLDRAREKYSALEIINTVLLDGMKTVGDLFGAGEMQLPFVLQSAETMKRAVAHLEQYMEKDGGPAKGCLVIATVRGDVHDIGKNLVDIILSNNGFKVVNLGIKQPLDAILNAHAEHKPDAIGMSGLLVKSTLVMKENLEVMAQRNMSVPVICGGAALTRAYVEVDLRQTYSSGPVYYGADAFTGLQLMNEITGHATERTLTGSPNAEAVRRSEIRAEREERLCKAAKDYAPSNIGPAPSIPTPPFWGYRHVHSDNLNLSEILTFINKKALFANQWMYRRGTRTTADFKEHLRSYVEPLFQTWCQRVIDRGWIQPRVAYGYFPCNSQQNDLIIFDPVDHDRERCRISFPRQVMDHRRCISDYFLPLSDSGRRDVVAFHVVSSGPLASEKCQELFKSDQYSDYLHFYGLSVESAEALAEFWHRRIRQELGILGQDGQTIDALFRQTYQGERYSFGYPACPNLEDQQYIFQLLKPEEIGITLSSEFQLVPEQSTSAIIVHHPDAAYFGI